MMPMLPADFMTIGIAVTAIVLIAVLFSLIASIFWVMMLIDCAKRDFKDKTVWVIIIIFTHFLGAALYYYTVKKVEDKKLAGKS
jgi:hypothetical protein